MDAMHMDEDEQHDTMISSDFEAASTDNMPANRPDDEDDLEEGLHEQSLSSIQEELPAVTNSDIGVDSSMEQLRDENCDYHEGEGSNHDLQNVGQEDLYQPAENINTNAQARAVENGNAVARVQAPAVAYPFLNGNGQVQAAPLPFSPLNGHLYVTRGQSLDVVAQKLNGNGHDNRMNNDIPPQVVETSRADSESDGARSRISGLGSTNSEKNGDGLASDVHLADCVRVVYPPTITQGLGMPSISNMPLVLRSRSLRSLDVATLVATATYGNGNLNSARVPLPRTTSGPSEPGSSNGFIDDIQSIPQAELVVDVQESGGIAERIKCTVSLTFLLLCTSVTTIIVLLAIVAPGSSSDDDSSITAPRPETNFPSPEPTLAPTQVYSRKQREGLEALYLSTNGQFWSSNLNWMSDITVCEWNGIACNGNDQVTGINLKDNNLTGSLSNMHIESLPYLEVLCLAENALNSTIPTSIFALPFLQILDLSDTSFTSSIPTEIGLLGELKYLSFRNSDLSSTLPTEIGLLKSLEHLDIAYNELTSTIPTEIGTLESVHFMDIGANYFESTIPSEIGNISSLKILHVALCDVTGSVPSEIGKLSSLEFCNFSVTTISEALPPEIGLLENLATLHLLVTSLSGQLPTEMGMLGNLKNLVLDGSSKINGSIPSEIGMMSKLDSFSASGCQLSSTVPSEIGNLQALEVWYTPNNNLQGSIPTEIGRMGNLMRLHLNNNNLVGEIPVEFGNMENLQILDASGNQLTGAVPEAVCALKNSTEGNLASVSVGCGLTCDCCVPCTSS